MKEVPVEESELLLQELEREMSELSSKIDALKVYLLGNGYRNIDDEDIYMLEEKEYEVRQKLHEMKTADGDQWEAHKEDTNEALKNLREAIGEVLTF